MSYAFDPTGTLLANKITAEIHALSETSEPNFHLIVPRQTPFFADGLIVGFTAPGESAVVLTNGIDYYLTHNFIGASRACAKAIYGSISFLNRTLTGQVSLTYQTLGGEWTLDEAGQTELLANRMYNPRTTSYEAVTGLPTVFPPIPHEWNLIDMVGMTEVNESILTIAEAINNKTLVIMNSWLGAWAQAEAWRIIDCVRNGDGAIVTANIAWPDGRLGVYTSTAFNVTNPQYVDAYTITYIGTNTRTVTQPAITRDGAGRITAQPALVIS